MCSYLVHAKSESTCNMPRSCFLSDFTLFSYSLKVYLNLFCSEENIKFVYGGLGFFLLATLDSD